MSRFKFKEFMIGAWWSVSGDEAAVKLYADCGFNVDLQSCRYELRKDEQLRVAEKYGLKVMIDTYICWPPPRANGHWATLDELKWLERHYGDHPAVIGFLINDNCHLDERTQAIAQHLRQNSPELMAWVSTNPDPALQAKLAGALPILTSQNYPFLWQGNAPDERQRIAFCNRLQQDRDHTNRHNMCMWPFVATQLGRPRNADQTEDGRRVSDSQTRFQVYTSIAYGAQGLPYFMYWHALANDDGPTDLYRVVQECNRYIKAVLGPRVLGHRCVAVYHSGDEQPAVARRPGPGEFIESMSDMTLAGVLVPESQFVTGENTPDYLMVVDKRTVKSHEEEPAPRRIKIRLSPGVKTVEELLPNGLIRTHDLSKNREITLAPLRAGEGVLLYVEVIEHMTLACDGVAKADIVVTGDASAPVQHAAAELARFLRQVTGADFVIRQQPGDADFHLLVGPGAARFADESFTTDGLGHEGIVLRTCGNNVILAGGHPRGTLYAVFTFLEDYVGCRWWASDATTVPKALTLTIPPLNVRYVPPLEYRYSFWMDAFDPDWAVRNKSNGPKALNAPKYGGCMTHGGVHTFYRLIPPDKYFQDHPEWFSLVRDPNDPNDPGERRHDRRQLCLANDAMRKELVKNLKARIREHPDQRVFSVSQNDWGGRCACKECRAADEAAGSPAGSLLRFVNAVAEEIEGEFPDASISTLAYQYTRKPPVGIRPRHNVIIQLCSIECDFSVPLTDERNRAFRDDIIGWSKVADRLYIWDYVTNFAHHFLPHPNLRVLGPNVRFFVEHSVKGIFEQGAYTTRGAEFAELRAWVLARLLWDPTLDDRALIEEFCDGYYGPAGRHILAYIDLVHDSSAASGKASGCFAGPTPKYLSFDVLNRGYAHMQAAAEAVAGDAALSGRVEMARLPVIYAFMSNWNALRAQCEAGNGTWPMAEDIASVAEKFKRVAKAHSVTRVNEWHKGFGLVDQAVERAKIGPERTE